MHNFRSRLIPRLSLVCSAAILVVGCAPIKYHTLPEGRPSSELVVAMPPGSSGDSYVILSAYEQPGKCLGSMLLPKSRASHGDPAINLLEAGRLQTVRMTLMQRGVNGHQFQCAGMLGFLPEAGVRYEINPLSPARECVPVLWRQGPDGARLPAEYKVRTPAADGFFTNTDGACTDAMVLK